LAPSPRENAHFFGHAAASAAIEAAVAGGRLHHAWLITGAEGVGKATLAFRFARLLLGGQDARSATFQRIAAGAHADLLTIEREWDEKKKRLKKAIAVDDARRIAPFLQLTPAEGGWRVIVIDGAEDLNKSSANALLKVLEEPPARAVLILVCSTPGRLLPTIRSRCRALALDALDDAAMAQALAVYLPEMAPEDRSALAAIADGSPGRALALAEEGGLKLAGMVREVLEAGTAFPLQRAYQMADLLRDQAPFETFLTLLRSGIARAVSASVRGQALPAEALLVASRPIAEWGEITQTLARLLDETEAANLDRRQAVVAGLALVRGA
jgi:DNA polymerase-3 subunit delta'